MVSSEGSGTPRLEPDSCLDSTCLAESDCCLTRGWREVVNISVTAGSPLATFSLADEK